MHVPFLNLRAAHDPIRAELLAAFNEVIDTSAFAGGPFVAKFEGEFAAFCRTEHAIGLGNGTDALWLSLLALGVGPGDEVITVPSTFLATAEAITYTGAKPVFVDIEEQTYAMNPELLEQAITARTKAIIPVHLFGQVADMEPIMAIARKHGVAVVEDACQAHGAEYKGRAAGSIGDTGCFSFYPGKNLGALGEAGAVVTNSADLKAKIQMLRDHGQSRKYHHAVVGWNARMDGFQGAALQIKLKHLAKGNEARREHARQYDRLLGGVEGVIVPQVGPERVHVYHIYAIRVQRRDWMLQTLAARGVSCGIHYPVPVHLQEAYRGLGYTRGSFPVAERCADEFLSLPMFPELSAEQIDYVCGQVIACVSESKHAK
jgi:dTDP-4-amino-4,6-dideoxygalactose transaminase